jgi:hypothetical protein
VDGRSDQVHLRALVDNPVHIIVVRLLARGLQVYVDHFESPAPSALYQARSVIARPIDVCTIPSFHLCGVARPCSARIPGAQKYVAPMLSSEQNAPYTIVCWDDRMNGLIR